MAEEEGIELQNHKKHGRGFANPFLKKYPILSRDHQYLLKQSKKYIKIVLLNFLLLIG